MRHCENETVEVFELEGLELSEILVQTALKVKNVEPDSSWQNLTISTDIGDGPIVYRATLYIHY